jgi:hypothetical protein
MRSHLQVAVHPFPEADRLADLEHRVLSELDPPLNLAGRPRTALRDRLSGLRALIGAGTAARVTARPPARVRRPAQRRA